MVNLFFSEEHELFRSSLQDFFKTEVTPFEEDWDREGKIPRSLYKNI